MKILQHCDNESTAKLVIFIKKYREKTQENKEKEKYTSIYRKYKNAETPVITKIRKTQPLHKISSGCYCIILYIL